MFWRNDDDVDEYYACKLFSSNIIHKIIIIPNNGKRKQQTPEKKETVQNIFMIPCDGQHKTEVDEQKA